MGKSARQEWPHSIFGLRGKYLRVLIFRSRKEVYKALELLWPTDERDKEVSGIPFETSGANELVVPVGAVTLLRAKGLKFRAVQPITLHDLTPRQYKEMVRARIRLAEGKRWPSEVNVRDDKLSFVSRRSGREQRGRHATHKKSR